MKKLAAILLCLCMVAGLVSCSGGSKKDVPDGMQIASCAGADYFLFVPTTWNLNTQYGVSGAYFTLTRISNVSAAKYPMTEALLAEMQAASIEDTAGARIEWYRNTHCKPIAESSALGGSYEEIALETTAMLLGDATARQYRAKMTVNGKNIYQHQVIAERNGAFYVLTFMLESDLTEMLWSHVDAMIKEFKFTDTPYAPDAVKELEADPNAPAGMMLASNDEVAYRFYVPTSWKINYNERIFAAYVEEDRTSVSVVPYYPDVESLSVGEFYMMSEDMMIQIAGRDGFERISADTNWKLGERNATAYRYRLTIEGQTYEYLQVIAAYKSMIYSVTYTASSQENYDKHYAELEQIVAAFCFR